MSTLKSSKKYQQSSIPLKFYSSQLGLLVARQSTATLCYLLENYEKLGLDSDFIAHVISHMIVPDHDLSTCPSVEELYLHLQKERHPLFRRPHVLPLHLLSSEVQFPSCLKQFDDGGGSVSVLPFPSFRETVNEQIDEPLPFIPQAERLLNRRRKEAFKANFRDWRYGLDVAFLRFENPIDKSVVLNKYFLDSLNLESLTTKAYRSYRPYDLATSERKVITVSLERVFLGLFAAAANGGAYKSYKWGTAYGRLKAWEAMRAFANVPEDFSYEQANEAFYQHEWFQFGGTHGWFCDVAWDFGAICLHKGGKELVIVAATDSD